MKVSFEVSQPAVSEPVVESTVTVGAGPETQAVTEVVDVTPVSQIPGTAVAVREASPISAPSPIVVDDENIGFDDIILPRINIVQKVGDLSNIFNGGEIVLKQELVVYSPPDKQGKNGTEPLLFTVLGFKKKQFVEKVEGGAQGLLLNNEQEVVRRGGTLDWKEWDESIKAVKDKVPGARALRLFQRLATALVLVQRPAHLAAADPDNIHFPYECEGAQYALTFWAMKGTAYTHAAKHLFTARKIGHLKQGYSRQSWSLSTKLDQFGSNFAYVPVIKPATKSSPAFLEFVQDTMSLGK